MKRYIVPIVRKSSADKDFLELLFESVVEKGFTGGLYWGKHMEDLSESLNLAAALKMSEVYDCQQNRYIQVEPESYLFAKIDFAIYSDKKPQLSEREKKIIIRHGGNCRSCGKKVGGYELLENAGFCENCLKRL